MRFAQFKLKRFRFLHKAAPPLLSGKGKRQIKVFPENYVGVILNKSALILTFVGNTKGGTNLITNQVYNLSRMIKQKHQRSFEYLGG